MSSHSVHTTCTQVCCGVRPPTAHAQLCAEHPVLHDVWGDGAHLAHHGEQPENSEWMSSPALITVILQSMVFCLTAASWQPLQYQLCLSLLSYCCCCAHVSFFFNSWRSGHLKRDSQASEKMWSCFCADRLFSSPSPSPGVKHWWCTLPPHQLPGQLPEGLHADQPRASQDLLQTNVCLRQVHKLHAGLFTPW